VVDGTGLENRHTLTGIGGSNPSLSATASSPSESEARQFDRLTAFFSPKIFVASTPRTPKR
jgi:hypothetical protein